MDPMRFVAHEHGGAAPAQDGRWRTDGAECTAGRAQDRARQRGGAIPPLTVEARRLLRRGETRARSGPSHGSRAAPVLVSVADRINSMA
jgi:hypothetical protein